MKIEKIKARPALEGSFSGRWNPVKEVKCSTVAELLAYLRVAKELGHPTIAFDDPKARSFGFVDEVLDVSLEISLTAVRSASEEEKSQLGDIKTTRSRAEAFGGSLDSALQAILDEAGDAPETVEELEALWDLKGAVELERVKVDHIEPPAGEHGGIPREDFYYLQPLAEDIGMRLSGRGGSYETEDVEAFAAELRTRRGIIRIAGYVGDPELPGNGPGLALLTSKGTRMAGGSSADLPAEEVQALLGSLGSGATFGVWLNEDFDIVLRWRERERSSYRPSVGKVDG